MASVALTLRDRWQLAKRVLAGSIDSSPSSAGSQLLAKIYPGRSGGEPPDRGVAAMLEAYSTMPWLRACAGKIAASWASVEWKLYVPRSRKSRRPFKDSRLAFGAEAWRKSAIADLVATGDVDEVSREHPFLSALDRGTTHLPGVAMRRVLSLHVDLAGEAFLLKERNVLGAPIAFWPIPPQWVLDTPTPSHPMFRVSYRTWQAEIPATDMLWVKDPNPAQPYGRGTGYGKALADELETDEFAAKTTRQAFFNKAQPDFLVYPKGDRADMGKPELARFEQDWLQRVQGYWRAYKPYFLSREIGVYEFQKDFRALQLRELREFERNVIVQVFGLPPEKLGILENSNRATIDAADLMFAKDVLTPRLEFWRSYFQEQLIPEYDENLIVDYVSPITEDKDFALKAAQAAPWAATVDEWRGMMGLPDKDDASGTLHLVPLNLTPVAQLEAAPEPDMLAEHPDDVVAPTKE